MNMQSFAPPTIGLSPSTTQLRTHSHNKSVHLNLLNSYLLSLELNAIHWSLATTAMQAKIHQQSSELLPESYSI